MEEALTTATTYVVLVTDALALIVIAYGTAEAFIRAIVALLRSHTFRAERAVWLRYAHWLVAGLTFQLAGDIVETSIAPTWGDIGRIAAIAVIRTFLDITLDRKLTAREEAPPAA